MLFIGILDAKLKPLSYQTFCVRTGYVKLRRGHLVALFFLIVVLLLMVALITLFAFPPHRWAEWFTKGSKKK